MKSTHKFLNVLAAGTMLAASNAYAVNATSASVYLHADPGSYVGGSYTNGVTWVHGIDGLFSESVNYNKGASISYQGTDLFNFDFAAPTYDPVTNTTPGNNLTVKLYDNAARFPFNSPTKPGLNVSGAGAGYNQLSGSFDVLEVVYDATNTHILKLAVNFKEYGENLTQSGPALYGSLRFNSLIPLSIPSAVPEPSMYLMMAFGLGITALVASRRKAVNAA